MCDYKQYLQRWSSGQVVYIGNTFYMTIVNLWVLIVNVNPLSNLSFHYVVKTVSMPPPQTFLKWPQSVDISYYLHKYLQPTSNNMHY